MTTNQSEWAARVTNKTVQALAGCWDCPKHIKQDQTVHLVEHAVILSVLEDLVAVLFHGCHGFVLTPEAQLRDFLETRLTSIAVRLQDQVYRAYHYECVVAHGSGCTSCPDFQAQASSTVERFMAQLQETQAILKKDIDAAFEGDPAAKSPVEVVMSYPSAFAITVHRVAHILYQAKVPLIPRLMSECAHSRTGIDIHPGAKIGWGFFIDHGTGVVIGETCVIGNRVKLYQGVTLGAVSFEKDASGNPVKGIKRHPNVGDNVVIYAGATILGGETNIGSNSIVGGNVWLTHSVPANSRVYNQQPQPRVHVGSDADAGLLQSSAPATSK